MKGGSVLVEKITMIEVGGGCASTSDRGFGRTFGEAELAKVLQKLTNHVTGSVGMYEKRQERPAQPARKRENQEEFGSTRVQESSPVSAGRIIQNITCHRKLHASTDTVHTHGY